MCRLCEMRATVRMDACIAQFRKRCQILGFKAGRNSKCDAPAHLLIYA